MFSLLTLSSSHSPHPGFRFFFRDKLYVRSLTKLTECWRVFFILLDFIIRVLHGRGQKIACTRAPQLPKPIGTDEFTFDGFTSRVSLAILEGSSGDFGCISWKGFDRGWNCRLSSDYDDSKGELQDSTRIDHSTDLPTQSKVKLVWGKMTPLSPRDSWKGDSNLTLEFRFSFSDLFVPFECFDLARFNIELAPRQADLPWRLILNL